MLFMDSVVTFFTKKVEKSVWLSGKLGNKFSEDQENDRAIDVVISHQSIH